MQTSHFVNLITNHVQTSHFVNLITNHVQTSNFVNLITNYVQTSNFDARYYALLIQHVAAGIKMCLHYKHALGQISTSHVTLFHD